MKCLRIVNNFNDIKTEDINKTLYIFKVDSYIEGKTGPNVEYEVYYPFDNINI